LSKTVLVEIYGQRYAVTGEADEGYIREVAQLVDTQIRDVAQGMKTATLSRLAVLAALNLAHQLLQAERKGRQLDDAVEARAGNLLATIDSQLQPL
jgi:cell division protein ZapA